MPRLALETIAASATAPGAAPGAAMAPVAGDSLRVRDAASSRLLSVAANIQGAAGGTVRITSPLLHDNTVGINFRSTQQRKDYWSQYARQPLRPQDTLSLNCVGSAVAGDVELAALTLMYEDMAGVDANLIDSSELRARAIELFSPRQVVTTTAAGWTGSVVLTALDDAWKANDEYAWLGLTLSEITINTLMFGVISPDWGNLRIGCPIDATVFPLMSEYFVWLADRTGERVIPVLNASQKSNIFCSVLGNENVSVVNASMVMARLAPKGKRQ